MWVSREPAGIFDIADEANFPRLKAARNDGLHSALASPVVVNDEMLGVIEFFTMRLRPTDPDLLEMLRTVAGNLGQFIQRKKAEIDLQRNERELTDFFDNATIGLHWVGPDGILLRANRAEMDMLGYSEDEYIGHPIAEFHVDQESISEILRRLKAGEKLEEYPARLRCKNGSIKDVLIDSSVLWNDGQFIHTRCFTREITERKRVERALADARSRLDAALQAGAIATWTWDIPNNRLFADENLARLFNLPLGEADGGLLDHYLQSIHPDDLPKVSAALNRSVETGEDYEADYRIVQPDGSVRWVTARGRAERDTNGRPVRMPGVLADITDRKRLEEELRFRLNQLAEADHRKEELLASLQDSEERLRLALESGPMGVWDWNLRTNELKWSDSLEPLHGLAPGTFGGTLDDFQKLVHPDDRTMVTGAIDRAINEKGGYDIEFRNIHPNGSVHWIAGKGKVFADDNGTPNRMIGIGLDVTRRKRSEQTARFLSDASASLATLVDFESTLQKVASLSVPYFADWTAIDFLEEDGSLRRVAVAHVDAAKVQLAHDIYRRRAPDPAAPQGVWKVLRTGRSELVAEITDELLTQSVQDVDLLNAVRTLGLRSYIGVPLKVRGRILGVLTFIAAESGHTYDDTDLAVAEDLAGRAGIAIENAQLYRELREADRRKDDFLATLAHELRNPLAPIRNGLQILRLAGSNHDAAAAARSMMDRQVGHMVRLVDDLLDVRLRRWRSCPEPQCGKSGPEPA